MAKKFKVNVDMDNNKIVNLTSPTAGTDGVNKDYVDTVARGLRYRTVRARSTGNVDISQLNNNDVIDGVTLATGDFILLADQTTATEDGIYTIGATAGTTVRCTTLPGKLEVGDDARGLAVSVNEGTANGNKVFVQTAEPAIVGTNGLVFGDLSSGGATYTAGNGLTDSPTNTFNVGNTDGSITVAADAIRVADQVAGAGLTIGSGIIAVGAGTGITVAADAVSVDTSTVARAFSEAGSGTSTTHTMTHSLGKQWVIGAVYLISTEEQVEVDIVATDTNTTTFTFGSSVDKSLYRFVVVG